MSFVHLHMHTQFSLLDGANKVGELLPRVAQLDQAEAQYRNYMDVQAKRADEARKQIANLKAMDAAYVARYSARAKSVPSDLWKEVEVKLGLFLDNASQYYRSVRDNYPKGITVWGAGYENNRPMAMPSPSSI